MHHHGVTFNFGSAKEWLPAIFETCFSFDTNIWIAATDYYMYFTYLCFSIDSYNSNNTFYRLMLSSCN